MSLLRIAHGMLVCALVFSADAALASAGTSAGVSSTQPNAVTPDSNVTENVDANKGAVPAKDVKQLHKQLNTEQEQQ